MEPDARRVRRAVSTKYRLLDNERVDFNIEQMGANRGAFTSQVVRAGAKPILEAINALQLSHLAPTFMPFPFHSKREWTAEELTGRFGFRKIEWDGRCVLVIA